MKKIYKKLHFAICDKICISKIFVEKYSIVSNIQKLFY